MEITGMRKEAENLCSQQTALLVGTPQSKQASRWTASAREPSQLSIESELQDLVTDLNEREWACGRRQTQWRHALFLCIRFILLSPNPYACYVTRSSSAERRYVILHCLNIVLRCAETQKGTVWECPQFLTFIQYRLTYRCWTELHITLPWLPVAMIVIELVLCWELLAWSSRSDSTP